MSDIGISRQPTRCLATRSTLGRIRKTAHQIMSKREITLVGPSEEKRVATVSCDVRHWNEKGFSRRECRIELRANGFDLHSAAWDFFEAFCGIRDQLSTKGVFPLCYGASRCVYPSGMLRDMAAGLTAYRMQMGKAIGRGDEVNIFDNGPDVEVATVAAQRAFFSEWYQLTRERLAAYGDSAQDPSQGK